MNKKLILFCSMMLFFIVKGKSQALPLTYFPAGYSFCDTTPYKLVFFDDFNGSLLDTTKWCTWVPEEDSGKAARDSNPAEIVGGDNFELSRSSDISYGVIRDSNVQVYGGVAHLMVRHQYATWWNKYRKSFTLGMLANKLNWHFSAGKFEAKIRFPRFSWAHCTWWIWEGYSGKDYNVNGNEIDFAEATGDDPRYPTGTPWYRNRFCNYSTHNWPSYSNPLHLSHHEIMNHYPGQAWNDYSFQQDDFHVYTCEWDNNVVKFYLDGNLMNTIYRYFNARVTYHGGMSSVTPLYFYYVPLGPGLCTTTVAGNYGTTLGFPPDSFSHSMMRFNTDLDHDMEPVDSTAVYPMGEMQIEYVRVWQRHPEVDANTLFVCPTPTPSISGPDILCNSIGHYSMPYSVGSIGNWNVSDNLGSNSTATTINAKPEPGGAPNDWGIIEVDYTDDCGVTHPIVKRMDVGPPNKPNVTCVKSSRPSGTVSFQFAANRAPTLTGYNLPGPSFYPAPTTYLSPTTFEWDIDYGPYHLHTFGQYVSTPYVFLANPVAVSWTLKVTNACGTVITSGNQTYTLRLVQYPPLVHYFSANIFDTAAFEQTVIDQVGMQFVTDTTDTVAINTMVERIRFNALQPYLIYDSTFVVDSNGHNTLRIAPVEAGSKIYPNPTTGLLNIQLGSDFVMEKPKTITVTNITGKVIVNQEITSSNRIIRLDMSQFPTDNYILEIKQNDHIDQLKFMKK